MKQVRRFVKRVYCWPKLLLWLCLVCSTGWAQDQTSRFVYDDKGRLRAVIAPNGEAAIYEYDAAGNFTAIRRLDANSLELLDFAPRSGLAGTLVSFYGVGFGTITAEGLFTAAVDPPATFEATIRAQSVAFPTVSAFAQVRVLSFDDARFALSPGIAIGKGADYAFGVFSQGVAVSKGDNFTGTFSPGVSLGKGERFIYGAAISPGVSLIIAVCKSL